MCLRAKGIKKLVLLGTNAGNFVEEVVMHLILVETF